MKIVFAEPIGLSIDQKRIFSDEMMNSGHSVEYFDNTPKSQDELLSRVTNADIMVVSNYTVSENVVNLSKTLKLIAVAFTGIDHIPQNLCKEKGISVCNAAGYSTQAVAELTIALAIDLLRKIIPFDDITRKGGSRSGYLGSELHGKTFGIVGFGAIGQNVAKLAQAFGCNVAVHSRTIKKFEGVDFMDLDSLLNCSDIVSLHLPFTDQTRNLIDEKALQKMKSNAILINTARGPIVNSIDLSNALYRGVIAGAAIDVYEHEPPIESSHPLLFAKNAILLPHIGFATVEAISERSRIVLDNINSWLSGNPKNQVI